jgi:hypothetical protein
MFNNAGSSPTVTNCTFTGNRAGQGGGVYNAGGTWSGEGDSGAGAAPTFFNCSFVRNAANDGGGMYNAGGGFRGDGASATVTNCSFNGNSAGFGGGVLVNGGEGDDSDGASAALTDCTFVGNTASDYGGGLITIGGERGVSGDGGAALINCTLVANVAQSGGGTFMSELSGQGIISSILWGNRAADDSPRAQIADDAEYNDPGVGHSLVQGGWPGAGNLDADPLFVRNPMPGPDGDWGTADDDYGDLRLRPGSPAIDAGDTAAVPAGVTTDLAGQPRVQGSAVDMGAYESEPAAATLYEAEQAKLTGAGVASDHAGYTGSGFVDFFHPAGDAVEFAVNAPSAGAYELSFRYANAGSSTRTTDLYVNGARMPGGVAFARTASWTTWAVRRVTVSLAAGANAVRLQTSGQNGPNLDSLSVRLLAPQQAVTYQAEAATLSGPLVASNVGGYTGTGFADYRHGSGDYVEFAVDVPAAGSYALGFRYANGSASDRPLELSVDGQVLTGRVSFAPTGAWRTWKDVTRPAVLSAGMHRVRLTSVGSNGPNLDALVVSPAATPPPPVEPVTLQAEAAALSGPIVASNISGFTGTGFADYQHAKGDSVEFTYTAPRAGDYVLGFRYANGSSSDRPLELRVNGALALRSLAFAPTGSWRTWALASPTVALAAGVNRIRLTTTGSNGPNLDALTVAPAPSA